MAFALLTESVREGVFEMIEVCEECFARPAECWAPAVTSRKVIRYDADDLIPISAGPNWRPLLARIEIEYFQLCVACALNREGKLW